MLQCRQKDVWRLTLAVAHSLTIKINESVRAIKWPRTTVNVFG